MITSRDKEILKFIEEYRALTIFQAYRIFFNESKYGYNIARRRLSQLEEIGMLKSCKNKSSNQKVYYMENPVSAHDLFVIDFYSLLVFNHCKNIIFKTQPRYLNGQIRPDAYLKYEYGEEMYFILLEVDFTHFTNLIKFQTYEILLREGEIQKDCFGIFPSIVVMGVERDIKYESKNLNIVNLDVNLKDFGKQILGIA